MYIIGAIILVLLVIVIILYNTIISKRNKLTKAYASLDVMLKKRYDLIPNIVECVKSYSNYEKQTLEKIIKLRSNADECKSVGESEKVSNEYNHFITDVHILAENYPELKANKQYLNLQKVLIENEEQISAARRTYNAHVESFNTYISMIPINIFAKLFGFKKYEYFEINSSEKELNHIM